MSVDVTRLTAALEGRYAIEGELGWALAVVRFAARTRIMVIRPVPHFVPQQETGPR